MSKRQGNIKTNTSRLSIGQLQSNIKKKRNNLKAGSRKLSGLFSQSKNQGSNVTNMKKWSGSDSVDVLFVDQVRQRCLELVVCKHKFQK